MKHSATYTKEDGSLYHVEYDDALIKPFCVNCLKDFFEDENERRRRYESRGNYCTYCNAGFSTASLSTREIRGREFY